MNHTFGITLSGGGVKGLAHAGVLQALDEHDLKPTCISATSAGAMVGALYASGIKPHDMLAIISDIKLFSFRSFNLRSPGFFDISPLEKALKKNILAETFDELPIEFHVIATNLETARSTTFSNGKLLPAILASSAFPMVFNPIEINGNLYADGGITNNFPVNVIRENCKYLLGVYVNPLYEVERKKLASSMKIADRVYRIAINYSSSLKFNICDKMINPRGLSQFGTFDMNKADKIFEIGYNTATDAIKEMKKGVEDSELNPIQRFFSKL